MVVMIVTASCHWPFIFTMLCAMSFMDIISFNFLSTLCSRYELQRKPVSAWWSTLPKAAQRINHKAGIWTLESELTYGLIPPQLFLETYSLRVCGVYFPVTSFSISGPWNESLQRKNSVTILTRGPERDWELEAEWFQHVPNTREMNSVPWEPNRNHQDTANPLSSPGIFPGSPLVSRH